jgi:hypothetical protein
LSQLSAYNVHLDITRRKNVNDRSITTNGRIQTTNTGFNINPELSDDDSNNQDEDLLPSATAADKIFSYDVPSTPRQFAKFFISRDVNFEEYVRVSFSTPPGGNSHTGGICSQKVDWRIAINAAETGSRNPVSPNNADDVFLTEINTIGLIATRPRIPSAFTANGNINVVPIGTSNPDGDLVYMVCRQDPATGGLEWSAVHRPAYTALVHQDQSSVQL